AAGVGRQVEVVLFFNRTLNRLEQLLDASFFRLGCTPAANLFEHTCEPVALTQQKYEYKIVPDVAQPLGYEVYSIESVTAALADAVEGLPALQEILRLYDYSDPQFDSQLASVNRQLIEGIVSLKSRRVVGRTGGPTSSGFCRGVEVTLGFDEEKYTNTSIYL